MSGIFLYLTHIQTLRQVMGAEGPTSAMMQHAPMNTLVAILSSALSVLYIQMVTVFCILLLIHVMIEPVEIHNWSGAFFMLILSWASGVALGIIFMAAKPWSPDLVNHHFDDLHPRQHDLFGKDVHSKHDARDHVAHVRMEPAVPHHRSGPRPYLCELLPSRNQRQLSDLVHRLRFSFRDDVRVLYTQARLGELGCKTLTSSA